MLNILQQPEPDLADRPQSCEPRNRRGKTPVTRWLFLYNVLKNTIQRSELFLIWRWRLWVLAPESCSTKGVTEASSDHVCHHKVWKRPSQELKHVLHSNRVVRWIHRGYYRRPSSTWKIRSVLLGAAGSLQKVAVTLSAAANKLVLMTLSYKQAKRVGFCTQSNYDNVTSCKIFRRNYLPHALTDPN